MPSNFVEPKYSYTNFEIKWILAHFFPYNKKKKNVKPVILSDVQNENKKSLFSPPICIQMSGFYLCLLSIWIQLLQLSS